MTNWTRRRYIFLENELQAEEAAEKFERMLKAVSWRSGGLLWVRALGWWLVTLLILSLLLSYRPLELSAAIPTLVPQEVPQAPDEVERGAAADNTPAAGTDVARETVDEQVGPVEGKGAAEALDKAAADEAGVGASPAEDGAASSYENEGRGQDAETGQPYSPLLGLREYLARMSGVVPTACAITERGMRFPEARGDMPGSPALLWLLGIDEEGEDYQPCQWRRSFWSFLVAFSFDVGPIQRLTLFAMILAMVILKRERLGLDIDAAAFPAFTKVTDAARDQSGERQARHPIAVLKEPDLKGIVPFYPVPSMRLDGLHDAASETQQHKNNLTLARSHIASYDRTGPFDLMMDVLDTGAASGRRSEADKRMREAIFEYNQSLLGRLWPANYILWLLPTIGFLGTIYGISVSLVRAKGLFGGDESDFQQNIALVVDGLGVAFDTTSIALVCAAIVYYALLRTEWLTDKLTAHAQASLSGAFIARLRDREDSPLLHGTDGPPSPQSEAQEQGTAVPVTEALRPENGGGASPAGAGPPTAGLAGL